MSGLLQTIGNLIEDLPGKDPDICRKFLKERNFEGIREIVESDIYKVRRDMGPIDLMEEDSDTRIKGLLSLKDALDEYLSYLEVPDNSDDIYEECYV